MDRAEAVDPPAESRPLTDYVALGENAVGWSLSAEDMDEITPTGNVGDPTVATEEKDEALVEAAVSGIHELIADLEGETEPGSE